MKSLQTQYAPHNACFGCGPANPRGLQLQSFVEAEEVIANFQPKTEYEAFPGILNGGIVGTLLDCHSNWTAAWHLMQRGNLETPPCTVTAEYHVKLLRPTPSTEPLQLIAKVVSVKEHEATVEAKILVGNKVCATCLGRFVAVKPGHPAYHRW